MSVSWTASLITAPAELPGAPRFRRRITLDAGHGEVVRARWLVTAHGIVEASLDGRAVAAMC